MASATKLRPAATNARSTASFCAGVGGVATPSA
jgi:hypothetical protein